MLAMNEPISAFDTLRCLAHEVLQGCLPARLLMARALIRIGSFRHASQTLLEMVKDAPPSMQGELMGLLGRSFKDQARLTWQCALPIAPSPARAAATPHTSTPPRTPHLERRP